MAGDIKQTTAIKENQDRYGEGGPGWKHRTNEVIERDAIAFPGLVNVFEDETTKTVRHGTKMVEDAFAVFDFAYKKMLAREIEVEKRTTTHVAKLKDKAGQIFDALAKIEKLTGPDFESKLQRLERFANAVETLDRLNKNGKLADVARAIGGLSH
jgi:hypothetical protein